jgi:DNA-binding transcriptional regulator GbsR (MarR family)
MQKTVEDVRNELIDTFGEAAERYGMTRIAGLVKGILLTAREPLSLDDMAEMLEVSKASVSTNVRILERWKVVRRVFNRGDRKNYYQMRGDLWEIETEIVTTIAKDELEGFADSLSRWKQDLSDAEDREAEDGAFLDKRFGEFDEYLDAMKHILKIFTREGKVTPAVIKKIEIN